MIQIATGKKTWEEIENSVDQIVLYLNGKIGIIKNNIHESEIEETDLEWKIFDPNTILVTKKEKSNE